MQYNMAAYKNKEIILSQCADYTQLCSIKGINFTCREIDVIACILHGRVTKKIAIFLSISYKTVETHVRNI